jgi:large subunit ribosomal protein L21
VYAIIEDSGQQFKVSAGDIIRVDLRELADETSQLVFDRVLLLSDGESGQVGTPVVAGAKVVADIVDPLAKGEKIDIITYKRRKGERRRKGHRQKYIEVKIAEIVTK